MGNNRRTSGAKRQREANERERVRRREQRRADRRAARSAPTDATATTPDDQPILGVDGPRSLAELRATQTAATGDPPSATSADDGDPEP